MRRSTLLFICLTACGSDSGSGSGTADDSTGTGTGGDTEPTTTLTTSTTTTTSTSGVDTSTGGESSGGRSSSESSGGDPECPPGEGCFDHVPEGWNGPIVFDAKEGTDAAEACGDAYTVEEFAGYQEFAVADTLCVCDCTIVDAQCTGPVTLHRGAVCQTSQQSYLLTPFVLFTNNETTESFYWYDAALYADVTASPLADEIMLDPVTTAFGRGCGLAAEPMPCAVYDGICVPAAPAQFGEGTCIWQEGDVDCDTGYPTKYLIYEDIEDTRACSECLVTSVDGTCGTVTLGYDDPFGGGMVASDIPHDDCALGLGGGVVGDMASAIYNADADVTSATCTPGAVAPSGEATPAGPITVCCA